MKKALLIVCAVVCSVFYVAAQQYQDVVYLKNGSVVRGMILEQIPGKTIKIATDNGSQFIFTLQEVEKMTKELPVQQPQVAAPVKAPRVKKTIDWTPKYKGEVNIGYAITGSKFKWSGEYEYSDSDGESESDSEDNVGSMKTVFSRPLFETVHGIQVGPYLFVGAGIGLQYYCGKVKDAKEWFSTTEEIYNNVKRWNAVMLPIFADVKFMYPVNDNFTPYLNLGLGGTVGCYSSFNNTDSGEESGYEGDFSWETSVKARGGFYCDFGVGFRYKALNFGLGLQHQVFKMVSKSSEETRGYEAEGKSVYKTPINSFYVKVGVNF